MMLAAAPPCVMMPWIRQSGRVCWRSIATLLNIWMQASSALTPSQGSAEACEALPRNSNPARTMPRWSWCRSVRSKPWTISAQSTVLNRPALMSLIFPPPPSSAGVPSTWMRPRGSWARMAASAAPAPAPAVAITLWPHAWPMPGSASYSQRIAIVAPSPVSIVARPEVPEVGVDRPGRGQQRVDRQEDDRVAERTQSAKRQERRAAARRVVEEERGVELPRHPLDLLLGPRRFDEEQVGASPGRGRAAAERLVESGRRDRVGPRDDEEVRVRARLDRGADLSLELGERNDLVTREMSAALRRHLVLEVERRHPRALVQRHRPPHRERVAVAGVGVGDEGDPDRGGEVASVVDHLAEPREGQIGQPEP